MFGKKKPSTVQLSDDEKKVMISALVAFALTRAHDPSVAGVAVRYDQKELNAVGYKGIDPKMGMGYSKMFWPGNDPLYQVTGEHEAGGDSVMVVDGTVLRDVHLEAFKKCGIRRLIMVFTDRGRVEKWLEASKANATTASNNGTEVLGMFAEMEAMPV